MADSTIEIPTGIHAFAELGVDTVGFAKVEKLSIERPEKETYVSVRVVSFYDNTAMLEFPFNRFYLEESKASEAEQRYWRNRTDSATICYARVKVYNGNARLLDVMVNDSSIVDIVRRINAGRN